MKTRIATIFSTIIFFLSMFPQMGAAQKAEYSVDKEFKWKDANKSMTILFDIQKKSSILAMSFAGAIEKGTLEVTIVDPKGEKIPGFMLVSGIAYKDSSEIRISVGEGETKILTTNKDGSVVSTTTSTSPSSASANASASSSTSGIGISSAGNSYAHYNSTAGGQGAKGVMNKVLSDPLPGKWKVLIELKNVTGGLNVAIDQD